MFIHLNINEDLRLRDCLKLLTPQFLSVICFSRYAPVRVTCSHTSKLRDTEDASVSRRTETSEKSDSGLLETRYTCTLRTYGNDSGRPVDEGSSGQPRGATLLVQDQQYRWNVSFSQNILLYFSSKYSNTRTRSFYLMSNRNE